MSDISNVELLICCTLGIVIGNVISNLLRVHVNAIADALAKIMGGK